LRILIEAKEDRMVNNGHRYSSKTVSDDNILLYPSDENVRSKVCLLRNICFKFEVLSCRVVTLHHWYFTFPYNRSVVRHQRASAFDSMVSVP
jgi:hypothetical protein